MSLQKIGAILRKAGHQASKFRRSGQVRGWGTSTEGYNLRKDYGAHMARLSYTGGTSVWARGNEMPPGRLDEYAELLRAAGFSVHEDEGYDCLLIDPPSDAT